MRLPARRVVVPGDERLVEFLFLGAHKNFAPDPKDASLAKRSVQPSAEIGVPMLPHQPHQEFLPQFVIGPAPLVPGIYCFLRNHAQASQHFDRQIEAGCRLAYTK